jgi:hypothetical protein
VLFFVYSWYFAVKNTVSNHEGISDNSSTHSQPARQLAKRFNSEQQLSLHSSFPCTAAFPAQPASHSPNKQALKVADRSLFFH